MKEAKSRDKAAMEKRGNIRKKEGNISTTNRIVNFVHKPLSILMALLLMAGLPVTPGMAEQVWAAENTAIKLSQTGGYFAVPGDTNISLTMRVENTGKSAVTFQAKTSLSQTSGAVIEPNPNAATITLEVGNSTEMAFLVDVSRNADIRIHQIPIEIGRAHVYSPH